MKILSFDYFKSPEIFSEIVRNPEVAEWLLGFAEPPYIHEFKVLKRRNKIFKVAIPYYFVDDFRSNAPAIEAKGWNWELWLPTRAGLKFLVSSRFTKRVEGGRNRVIAPNPLSKDMNPVSLSRSRWYAACSDSDRLELARRSQSSTITVHSLEAGYPYRLVLPHMGLEETLNKPVAELIGNPLGTIDNTIAEATRWAIDRAVRCGITQYAFYSFYWDSELDWMRGDWKKIVRATYLPGVQEVLVEKFSPQENQERDQRLWERYLTECVF
jgi:hypothetical protein